MSTKHKKVDMLKIQTVALIAINLFISLARIEEIGTPSATTYMHLLFYVGDGSHALKE